MKEQLHEDLKTYVCGDLEIDLFGVASAHDFNEFYPDLPSPNRFMDDARSIIVIGIPYDPEAASTIIRPDLIKLPDIYDIPHLNMGITHNYFSVPDRFNTNYNLLNSASYKISKWLRHKGWKAFGQPANQKDTRIFKTAFHHQPAAHLAGLGTWGLNHAIINPQFGPRFFMNTIITDATLEYGQPLEKELCTNCGLCKKRCPAKAIYSKEDKHLSRCVANCCGTCIAVCPIGERI
jgi:epoxyqueuosine reductase